MEGVVWYQIVDSYYIDKKNLPPYAPEGQKDFFFASKMVGEG